MIQAPQLVYPGSTSKPGFPIPTINTPELDESNLEMPDKIKALLEDDDTTLTSTVSTPDVNDVECKNAMVMPFYSRLSEHVAVGGGTRIVAGVLDVLLPYLPNLVSAQVPGLLGILHFLFM
jgi:hypothetical protein